MTLPSTTFLRDQLVACLRESFPTPLATDELIEAMPDWVIYRSVYRVLRSLESKGIICRAHMSGYRQVFWTALPSPESQAEIELLEKLLTLKRSV